MMVGLMVDEEARVRTAGSGCCGNGCKEQGWETVTPGGGRRRLSTWRHALSESRTDQVSHCGTFGYGFNLPLHVVQHGLHSCRS